MLFDDSNTNDGSHPKLVGLLIIHVDDISTKYLDVEKCLKKVFNFRTWETDTQTLEAVHQEDCWKKVKPITIHKGRAAEDEMNEHDKTQLRALLGSIQWPAVQTAPHVQCSASLISCSRRPTSFVL